MKISWLLLSFSFINSEKLFKNVNIPLCKNCVYYKPSIYFDFESDFNECEMLTVVLNKSVKMSMKWNGRVYEGRMAGMDFISNGPTVSKTQTASRG